MAGSTQARPSPRATEWIWRTLTFVVAVTLVVVILTRWTQWEGRPGWQASDDAYLQADLTPIAAKVPGYVRQVAVQDFAHVKAGDVIAEIVDDDYRAALHQAEAGVASSVAQSAMVAAQRPLQEANIAAARAVSASTAANLAQNARDIARQARLLATGSSSTEETEKLQTARQLLSAQLSQNQAQIDAATRQLGVLDAQEAQAQAAMASQKALLEEAQLNLAYTRILAPQDGVVGQRQVRPGQFVGVGGQITTLIPLPHVWVIANYKETQLTHMTVGERAEITVDTYPGHVMHGHLEAFSPGAGSQFTLLPPDNATGNFTKVVQRIPVKIVIDDADGLGDQLRAGMSVVARIDAEAKR